MYICVYIYVYVYIYISSIVIPSPVHIQHLPISWSKRCVNPLLFNMKVGRDCRGFKTRIPSPSLGV